MNRLASSLRRLRAAATGAPVPSKLQASIARLPYLVRAFELVWTAARGWTVAWVVLLLAQGVLPAATLLLVKRLVDALVDATGGGAAPHALGPVLLLGALTAGAALATDSLGSLTAWVRTAQAELVRDHVSGLIHEQALRLDLAFFETPECHDQLHRARVDAIQQPLALLEQTGGLVQNGIALVAMAVVVARYAWWLPPVLLASTLPALAVAARHSWRFHEWRTRRTSEERRTRYYDWMLTWSAAAAELRLFDLGPRFRESFTSLRAKLRDERLALARRQMIGELFAGVAGLLVTAATAVWLVARSSGQRTSLGDFAVFYLVFSQGQRLARGVLESLGRSYATLGFLEDLFEFLGRAPAVVDPAAPAGPVPDVRQEVRFERVTFRYPASSRPALSDFDLVVPAGKIVAVVGENGAGKSTLVKLLCRFYDPEAGRVLFDGVDAASLRLDDLRRAITVLFQEPVHYHETVSENVSFGDLRSKPGSDAVTSAAEAAGADAPIRRLPHGYETVLGRWFGGAELSVGEWQRIALARAFLRRAPLVLLDEPTSAMDSWAEQAWMARFRRLVAGRTALVITHRFTTARQADVIHVMADGRIVESGSHAELVEREGRYAKSWREQVLEHAGGASA